MTPFRAALRQVRHRPGYALLYALAVAVGGSVTGALGGYAAAVERTVRAQAKELWAADLTVEGSPGLLDRLEKWAGTRWPGGAAARNVETISMVRSLKGDEVARASLAAVTPNYPLHGAVTTAGGRALGDVLAPGRAVAAEKLLALLNLRVGDRVRVGNLPLLIADTVARRTDAPSDFFELSPALFLTPQDLSASGLLVPGSRSRDTLYLNLPGGVEPESALSDLREQTTEESARLRSWKSENRGVSRFLGRTLLFLNFLGLLLLALGGVGVAAAFSAALASARAETGVLLALGAPRGWSVRLWAWWAACLTAAGLLGAAVLGVWGAKALAVLFRDFLPSAAGAAGFSWAALGKAAAATTVSTAAFALFPMLALFELPPNAVLSLDEAAVPRRWGPRALAGAAALAGFAGVAWLHAGAWKWAAIYFAGGAGVVAAAGGLAWAGRRAAAWALGRSSRTAARLAGRGLARPGAMNGGVVAALALSIGLGLALYLLERNLRRGFAEASPESGPTAFFINLRTEDEKTFRRIVDKPLRLYPLVRGRVLSVNGSPARDIQRRADRRRTGDSLTREFGFSFGDALPDTDRIAAGPGLFDPAIEGPQVSVFDEFRERYGIRVGDRITVTVLGRQVTATVASLRSIDRSLRQPFFYLYFKPGSLGRAPYTLMGGAAMTKPEIVRAEKRLAAALPHATVIDLADVAALTGRVLNRLARAVAALGAVGVAGGLLLLGASLGVTLLDRARESVLYRTLGATVRQVGAVYAVEFLWIGLGAAAAGGAVGLAAAWGLTRWGLETSFSAPWAGVGGTLLAAALAVTAVSLAVTWRALRASPLEVLRNE